MKPEIIVRITDGEEFLLQENGKYAMKRSLPDREKGHLINEWDYEVLINTPGFKVKSNNINLTVKEKNRLIGEACGWRKLIPWRNPNMTPGIWLNAFYTMQSANTTELKIKALRQYFIKEDMLVTANDKEDELLSLEYYILDQYGFNT